MNILDAYIQYAWVIALFHAFLFVICIGCFFANWCQLRRERIAYEGLAGSGFAASPEDRTDISHLTELTFSMSRKGEIPSPEAIRLSMLRHLARYDVIVRFCLNAFIISGLLGTLFNLWKLGPSFWAGIISGKQVGGQPAIGIAFSASVFGLGFALLLSLLDSLWLRFRRESFVLEATAALFDVAVTLIPPTERAAVAEALQRFYSESEGLLDKFRSQHEDLSQKFITQIQSSSDKLNETMEGISGRWVTLVSSVTTTVSELGEKVGTGAHNLAVVTAKADEALRHTLPLLRQAEDLGTTLLDIRSQAEQLQNQITTRMSQFADGLRLDCITSFEAHADKMETIYSTGLSRFDEKAQSWHELSVAALTRFSENIESSMTKWSGERQKVGEQIDTLINNWRAELGRATTGVVAGLSSLRTESEALKLSSAGLAQSQATAFQQLRELQSAVATFSAKVIDGTPLGEAIKEVNESVKEFSNMVAKNGKANGSATFPRPPDTAVFQLILDELKKLSSDSAKWISRPTVSQSYLHEQDAHGRLPIDPQSASRPKRSLWERMTGRFRSRRG